MSETRVIERLFSWDAWANRRIVGALREGDPARPGVRTAIDRFAHILAAQEIWLSRLGAGEWGPGHELFPRGADVGTLAGAVELLAARWAQLCRVLDAAALDEPIVYTSTEGVPYTTARRDILLHVSHHGAYHRGQIAVDLKREGITGPATDYVAFVRAAMV